MVAFGRTLSLCRNASGRFGWPLRPTRKWATPSAFHIWLSEMWQMLRAGVAFFGARPVPGVPGEGRLSTLGLKLLGMSSVTLGNLTATRMWPGPWPKPCGMAGNTRDLFPVRFSASPRGRTILCRKRDEFQEKSQRTIASDSQPLSLRKDGER